MQITLRLLSAKLFIDVPTSEVDSSPICLRNVSTPHMRLQPAQWRAPKLRQMAGGTSRRSSANSSRVSSCWVGPDGVTVNQVVG